MTAPVTRPQCGTYAGAMAHNNHGETKCDPCRAAAREYTRQWRATHPEKRADHRAYNRARHRATERLIGAHPVEFARYLADERAKERDRDQ